jgi:membrane associated rhomboid family serine protease
MFSERDSMQSSRPILRCPVTIALLVLNFVFFLLQRRFPEGNPSLALSLPGLLSGYLWQVVTYQFMHGSWPHVLLNCWMLFVVGPQVEWVVGKARFSILYLCSGIVGGLLQMAAAFLWPHYFGGIYASVVGASASVFGVVAAFTLLFPDEELILLLFFIVPIKLRARWLLWLVLVPTALGISFPRSYVVQLLGPNVAHAAHLGGILTGLAFTRFYFLKNLPPSEPVP